jgi:peroxiredoxin
MRVSQLLGFALVLGVSLSAAQADEVKSGPGDKIGGAFNVKAITGEKKGDTFCYVCKYNGEKRPGVVLIFTQKADENLATLVKAVDEVQKTNAKLGTVVVGVSGVQAADFEKLQTTHKLTAPLTVATDTDGPSAYKLNKSAAVTVLVYKRGGEITQSYGFSDTQSAAAKAADGLDLNGDIHASEEYRAHLTRVFTRRALEAAASRA